MAKSEPRKILEREDVENIRKMIWRGKDEDYLDGWKFYARRAFDKEVVVPEKRKDGFYEGLHDARMFAKALYVRTAKLAAVPEEKPEAAPAAPAPPAVKGNREWNRKKWVDNEMSRFLKATGMKVAELADRMGIAPATASHIITGRGKMSRRTSELLKTAISEWEKEKTAL